MSGEPIDETAPLLGHVVAERYFVEKRLGEGGMGTVYMARHITLDKRVALKVLHGEFSRKTDLVERFLQEAKAASRIRNEHVIDITDFGITTEGFVFFAMEHLEGRDLHTLLRDVVNEGQLLPWPRAQNIFLQICNALSAAHAEGIIHRDLKPENIFLVDGTGRADYVKLLDFGIAKVESADGAEGERKLTKTGMLFGTPEYMAPEQARGEKPDHRVDVYAMGCLLFQLLTGTVPFKADSFMAILTQHMMEPVPEISTELLRRSGAPDAILDIVNKSLAKDRNDRFPDIRSFADAIANLQQAMEEGAAVRQRRATTGSSGTAWTGAVRGIDTLVELENEQEAQQARQEAVTRKGTLKFLMAAIGLTVVAGGVLATKLFASDDSQPAPNPPSVSAPVAVPALIPTPSKSAVTAKATSQEASSTATTGKAPSIDAGSKAIIRAKESSDAGATKQVRVTRTKRPHGRSKPEPTGKTDASEPKAETATDIGTTQKNGTGTTLDDDKKKPEDTLDAPVIMRPEAFE